MYMFREKNELYEGGPMQTSHLCRRRFLPPQCSNRREYSRDDKGKKIQGELDVPSVERRRVCEAVDDREDKQNLPGEGLQEVAHGVERKDLTKSRQAQPTNGRGRNRAEGYFVFGASTGRPRWDGNNDETTVYFKALGSRYFVRLGKP